MYRPSSGQYRDHKHSSRVKYPKPAALYPEGEKSCTFIGMDRRSKAGGVVVCVTVALAHITWGCTLVDARPSRLRREPAHRLQTAQLHPPPPHPLRPQRFCSLRNCLDRRLPKRIRAHLVSEVNLRCDDVHLAGALMDLRRGDPLPPLPPPCAIIIGRNRTHLRLHG